VLDRMLPLSSEFPTDRAFTSSVAAPGLVNTRASFAEPGSYFSADGLSLVAGRAALVPSGGAPVATAGAAARAGATAVLLYGARLPAGGVPLDEATPVPVVSVPTFAAARMLAAIARGRDVGVSIGSARTVANTGAASVASFSSTGLAYDGRVKPDVVAPGVAVATAEPGTSGDETARYVTVNGSSAAAAAVAGGAAVLAHARPELRGVALRSALVGGARRLSDEPVQSQGAGLVSLSGAAAAQLATAPTTLAFGNARSAGWHRTQRTLIRNISTRPVHVRMRVRTYAEGASLVDIRATPPRFTIPPGEQQRVELAAKVDRAPIGEASAEGSVTFVPSGGAAVNVPWVVTFVRPPASVLGPLTLSTDTFSPSDARPALLTFRAGRLGTEAGRDAVQPVARLSLELVRRDGKSLGTLATLRDLLPGRYAFGLTGRSSAGNTLGKGRYLIRVTAVPALRGPASVRDVEFTIR
jgi:hypothetical protein